MRTTLEFRNWRLPVDLGTYGPGEPVPDLHEIDLTLDVAPDRVMVDADSMDCIYDYDPLRDAILALAQSGHFETQEFFVTQIARIVARDSAITGAEIAMRKAPIWDGTGSAGVRLTLDSADLAALRAG